MVGPELVTNISTVGILEGNSFISGYRFTDIDKTGDTDRNIIIENPSDSGVYVVVAAPNITVSAAATTTPTRNVTVDTAGTAIDTINPRTDADNTSNANVFREVEFSGGDQFFTTELPSGQKASVGTTQNAFIIAPGDNVVTELTNVSTETIDASVEITFTETLVKNIPDPTTLPV